MSGAMFLAGFRAARARLERPELYWARTAGQGPYPPYIARSNVLADEVLNFAYSGFEYRLATEKLSDIERLVSRWWSSKDISWVRGFAWALVIRRMSCPWEYLDASLRGRNLQNFLVHWYNCRKFANQPTPTEFIKLYANEPLLGDADLETNSPTHTEEGQSMSTNHVSYPHVVLVLLENATHAVRPFVYDPEYFKLEKDDQVVVASADGAVFNLGKVQSVEGPIKFDQAVPPMVVSRIDMVQFESRRENIRNRRKALVLMQEAAKRNTEQDLFEQVKTKLTPEEREFIAKTLGYEEPAEPAQ